VRVYASNLEIGRTDSKGDLLIPNLLPYYANRIRIEDRDIPLIYEIARVEELVAPPNRGGGLVEFPVQKIQTSFGTLRMIRAGESIVPEFGQLTVEADGKRWDSPIGRGGAFYLENVPAGEYDATVLHKTGVCRLRLAIPVSDEQMLKLGELQCELK
jgi:outer membrane usher protein